MLVLLLILQKHVFNLLRDLGPALSPQNAFQFVLGLETLHVRMKEHVANTVKVV